MLDKSVEDALDDLEQIKGFARGFQALREKGAPYGFENDFVVFPGVSAAQLRVFEHCTAIIRTYTVFERLVYALAGGWLNWVLRNNPEAVLNNPKSRIAYEMGLAEIFKRQTEPRFSDVDRFSLAKSHSFFDTKSKVILPVEMNMAPFFATFPNLQISHICNLFVNVAIGSPENWLNESPPLLELRDEYSIGYAEALKDVVLRRNEVAHGNPDPGQLLGTNDLIARIEMVAAIGVSLYEFVLSSACTLDLGANFEKGLIGDVTHSWPKSGAFELVTTSSVLGIGEKVLVLEKSCIFMDTIKSIQIEDVATTGFCGSIGTALGVKLNRLPKQNAKLLRAANLRDSSILMK